MIVYSWARRRKEKESQIYWKMQIILYVYVYVPSLISVFSAQGPVPVSIVNFTRNVMSCIDAAGVWCDKPGLIYSCPSTNPTLTPHFPHWLQRLPFLCLKRTQKTP